MACRVRLLVLELLSFGVRDRVHGLVHGLRVWVYKAGV